MYLENYKVTLRDPIRIEKKLIDGKLVDVKVYAKSIYVEMPTNPVQLPEIRIVGVDSTDKARDKSFRRE